MGEGSEDLVELLIAAGLAAAGALAAPEEAHLELSAEHLEELRPGLETCRVGHRGQGTTIRLGKLGLLPGATIFRRAPFQGTSPTSASDPTRFVDEHNQASSGLCPTIP